jgi:hypothetical protein
MNKIFKFFIPVLFVVLSAFNTTDAQDYKFHSVFMYNFTKYIQWPTSYQSGDFVIGVLGDSPIIESLEKMAESKTVGAQKFSIVRYKSVDEINKCHMLFIPSNRSKQLKDALNKVNGQSTLVITEKNGLGVEGSCINFVLVDGKWKFELNKPATEKNNLKVSGDLAKLAILID